ncbi:hypothetical protein ACHAW5_008868 [Stephanodiscus triporus]|uniref:Peptidase M20 dimerisation domain-containing protein n=1 Tax=Stephanodiscus triporus TaxID=2934178 RepID=A0ABD3NQ62_9STRA
MRRRSEAADVVPTTEEILAAVDSVRGDAIEFLRAIVAIDSTLDRGEGRVQNFIHDHLLRTAPGLEVTRQPVRLDDIRDRRGYSPVDWAYDDDQKFNVVARCRRLPPPRRGPLRREDDILEDDDDVLLVGHVDVVPASSDDPWTDPPFAPAVRDGRMYGRGAGDMKGGVVAMVYAVVALRRLGYTPGGGGVTLCTVVEEECTGNGALAASSSLLMSPLGPEEEEEEGGGEDDDDDDDDDAGTGKKRRRRRRTAVIIPEPFPWIVTAQMGVLWFTATVTGRPCHVLSTSSGSNAIEGAYSIYESLRVLEARYNEPRGYAHPAYAGHDHPVNFNLGKISGGDWTSSVPGRCAFEARVGFLPGTNIDDVKRDVETIMRARADELGLGLEVAYRGFHADGAVLLPEYVDGMVDVADGDGDDDDDGGSLQRDFVETLRKCHRLATSSPSSSPGDSGMAASENKSSGELHLRPVTCTTDARFYSSLYHDPSKVVVTCFGPEATNIHGVDESVSLESIRDVTATIALFIRDWCGLVKDE